jgi:hypothetical protein
VRTRTTSSLPVWLVYAGMSRAYAWVLNACAWVSRMASEQWASRRTRARESETVSKVKKKKPAFTYLLAYWVWAQARAEKSPPTHILR